ncbi:MAG: hypothetical protein HKM02_10795 [Pseudomonadales bacterium]|nr:hypothetical protein [Pseudomonadales bacterium]
MTSAISSSTALKPIYTPASANSTAKASSKGSDGDGDHGHEPSVSAPSANTPSNSGTLGSIVNTHA